MGPKWLWVVITLGVIVLEPGLSNGCWEQEKLALLQLKSFFTHFKDEESSDCCQWKWVECKITTGRVTKLSLNNTLWLFDSQERRFLNASLFLPFEELRSLHLRKNRIAGCVENEGFGKLSKLKHLEILDLSWNSFNDSSTLLSSLSKISSLKSLSLARNFDLFTGSNHKNDVKWLSRLNGLETLDLGYTHLRNSFILHMNGLSSLRTLILSGNKLEGTIHIQGTGRQVRLINLEILDLSLNFFNNNILADLSGLSKLKFLNLRDNQLNGSVDIKEFCASNLETLDLSYNKVEQFVTSKENKCLRKLKVLYLDGVFGLEGISLVSLIEPFLSVKTLSLSNNLFSNKTVITEDHMHVLRNLEDLILDSTLLDISFLKSIGSLTSLKTLSLAQCDLTGTLPAEGWCYLKSLEELDLSENALEGVVASCLGNLTSLRLLDISNNQFRGNLESTPITNLTVLSFLSVSNNNFRVPISFVSFMNNSNLKVLLSDENKLVEQPIVVQTWSPKFQLIFFSLSHCTIEEDRKLQLPSFLYYQHNLRYIDLSYTKFGEISFPNWLIENNPRLEELHMVDSSIVGPLFLPSRPNYNLTVLDISENEMKHKIPPIFCSLFPNLQRLFMSRNAFKSNIPLCLGGMRFLSYLDISHNQLFGRLPKELAMSASLEILKLSNNSLTGNMFPAIYRSKTLVGLYLDGNDFQSDPPYFSPINSTVLAYLDLSDNHLSGKLPIWLWNYTNLKILALSNNQFEGPISKQLCNLDQLDFLDLSQNNLVGTIPSCFSLHNVAHVHLRKNKLSGPLPRASYESSLLLSLDLSENNFTENISDWMGALPDLNVLLLKANQFHGEFPMHLCNLESLSILDLSQNKLSGPVPSCLTLKRVVKLSVGYIDDFSTFLETIVEDMGLQIYDLKENVDPFFGFPSSSFQDNYVEEVIVFSTKRASYNYTGNILDSFAGIDLSCNKLTGLIPPELENLGQIYALNLSHNNLIGPIPSTLSKLKQIESLDLSYNNLNGRIPPQLIELNSLEVFTVAHNNLLGPLPDMKAQFGTFDESSYEGNPLLCGPPLKNNCSEIDSPKHDEDHVEHDFIDMGDFYISFVVSYVIILLATILALYINPYWRQAWFYFIGESSTACYFFIVDSLHQLSCYRRNT